MDSRIQNYSEHILLHMQGCINVGEGCIDVGEEIFKVLIYSIFYCIFAHLNQKTIFHVAPDS